MHTHGQLTAARLQLHVPHQVSGPLLQQGCPSAFWHCCCLQACKVPQDMRALMLAMAMQESTHMDVRERDASKDDHTDKAAKATIFNLSVVSATAEHRTATVAVAVLHCIHLRDRLRNQYKGCVHLGSCTLLLSPMTCRISLSRLATFITPLGAASLPGSGHSGILTRVLTPHPFPCYAWLAGFD